MNDNVAFLLNEQIEKEFESAYIYLSYAAYCDSVSLKGYSQWFKLQAQEEQTHAMKIYDYLNSMGIKIQLQTINGPSKKVKNLSDALMGAIEHEKYITALINSIYSAAQKDNDYATQNFLDWFVEEQVEEESTVKGLYDEYKMFGTTAEGLYNLNSSVARSRR